MTPQDAIPFSTLLDSTCSLLTRGQYVPNEVSTAMFFRALAPYSLAQVRAAFDAHVRSSRFSPTPADILDLLRAADGRPGAEEAWACCLRSRDEAQTVVWTEEMAAAWNVARVVLDGGDEVGARMAFREAYSRAVDVARMNNRPADWRLMLGTDRAMQADAIRQALADGRLAGADLERAQEALALPAPREVLALPAPEAESEAAALWRPKLAALADSMRAGASGVSADAEAKERTAQARREVAERVQAYEGGQG